MSGTTLFLVVINKKPRCSARFINTELIVNLLIYRGVRKVNMLLILYLFEDRKDKGVLFGALDLRDFDR